MVTTYYSGINSRDNMYYNRNGLYITQKMMIIIKIAIDYNNNNNNEDKSYNLHIR